MGFSVHDAENTVYEMNRSFSGDFEYKSYVLEAPLAYGDGIDRKWNVMKIRPLNVSRDKLLRMYSGTEGFSYTMGYAVMSARADESEQEFLIRAAAAGMNPEFRLEEDGDYNTLDFSDMATGESLIEYRKVALSKEKPRG